MIPLGAYVSPFNTYQTIDDVVAAASRIHLDGFQTRVLLPTLYGELYQGSPRILRTLGDALCANSPGTYEVLRAAIEAAGVPCDGWSVPTAPCEDADRQGYAHGAVAAVFDRFVINLEHGWSQFWSEDGADIVTQFLTGFWRALGDAGRSVALNGNVGLTIVTNTAMMQALDDDEAAAWIGGTSYDALEAYIPGDPGLDPENALNIWHDRLVSLGIPLNRPVVVILEQGDLPALVQNHAHPTYGAQLWTLQSAAQQTWPTPAPPEDPCAGVITGLAYIADDLGDKLLAECKRPQGVRKTVVRGIVAEMQRVRTQSIGARPT